ncbi:MAG: 3,4-dihydroxy-2-butanone-4-phosphate synthase [Pseudomonadota bacterium]
MSEPLATPDELIAETRAGRMTLLVDDERRENEGDLIIPAQHATPEAIAFMAAHGRGLICLCLTEARVAALGLGPMVQANGTRHGTAFTASIDAADMPHNPVSAAGRAHTVAVAINEWSGPDAVLPGGRVFPLISRDGGVLVRTGHTEAAVDLSRLAGLHPSSVICEVMHDDGTMARLPDLRRFARRHGIKLGTIRDLVLYRRRRDRLLERVGSHPVDTAGHGRWTAVTYRNRVDGAEVTAFVKGHLDEHEPTLVRVHVPDPVHDIVGAVGPRQGIVDATMRQIADAGRGVLLLINPASYQSAASSFVASEGRAASRVEVLRDFGIGAELLADLGVRRMILLTDSHVEPVGLAAWGLSIDEERPIHCNQRVSKPNFNITSVGTLAELNR